MQTTEQNGLLNNFAKEPKVYYAESPNSSQQMSYVIQATLAATFLGGIIATAFLVS